jgi:hypothetical protein
MNRELHAGNFDVQLARSERPTSVTKSPPGRSVAIERVAVSPPIHSMTISTSRATSSKRVRL